MDGNANQLMLSLQAQCVKREYCVQDIRRKAVEKLDGDRDAAEEVVQALIADKFVSDARYASAFAREKSSLQGWGAIKIRYQLRAKGVSDEAIATALEEVDPSRAQDRLEKLLAAKYRTLEGDPQCRLKLLKFALELAVRFNECGKNFRKVLKTRFFLGSTLLCRVQAGFQTANLTGETTAADFPVFKLGSILFKF